MCIALIVTTICHGETNAKSPHAHFCVDHVTCLRNSELRTQYIRTKNEFLALETMIFLEDVNEALNISRK